MRSKQIINAFLGGEISPEVYGRTETEQYPYMVEEMRNCIPSPRGGAKRRGGMHYIRPCKYSDKTTRLVPFVFSIAQSYMMEMGDGYVRFMKDSGWIENPYSVQTYFGQGLKNFDYLYPDVAVGDIKVEVDGVLQTVTTDYTVTTVAGVKYIIVFTDAQDENAFITIFDDTPADPEVVYTPDLDDDMDAEVFEIVSPFDEDEIEELYFAQANDVMIFVTEGKKPWRLTRYAPSDWRWDQPYLIGVPWEGESNNYQADSTQSKVYGWDFTESDKDRIVVSINGSIISEGTGDLQYQIDIGDKEVTLNAKPLVGDLICIQGIDTYDSDNGYPRTVVFYQERLWFGGTPEKPQTLWGSRSADFYDFVYIDTDAEGSPVLSPDDAVEYTIAAYTHEAIEWLSSERVLVIGTSATEHRLSPDQYIATDRLPTVSRMSAYGGAHTMPVYMGDMTVFIQATGTQVRTFNQSEQSIIEKWESIELDFLAKHLTETKVKQMCYALVPDSYLAMTTLDGDMLTMTYDPTQDGRAAWAKHETEGNVVSTSVMPEDYEHQVWCIVERNDHQYLEYLDPTTYTDSCLTYPPEGGGAAIQTVGGLIHLEGLEVTIKADGGTHPNRTVLGGEVELDWEAETIEIGLAYTPRIKLTRPEMGNPNGTAQFQVGRWSEIWVRLVESAYPLINGYRAAERDPDTSMGTPEPIVTGDVSMVNLGHSRDKEIIIEQDLPVPMYVTAVGGTLTVNTG